MLWERDGLNVVQLLGVAGGRLFVTTREGVQAIGVGTGLTVWQQPSEGKLAGLGRGLIVGGWLLWPTHDPRLPLRALTLAEGAQQRGDDGVGLFAEPSYFDPTQLRHIPPGNLAFGQGCLIVAGTDALVGFVPAEPLPAMPDHRPHVQTGSVVAPPVGGRAAWLGSGLIRPASQ
jgi:hypothetical protein